jgi:polysaccharide export outer membrane protein
MQKLLLSSPRCRAPRYRRRSRILLLFLLAAASCLRYTPSREELDRDPNTSGVFAGEDEFHGYEERLKARLHNLIADRADLVTPDPLNVGYPIGPGDTVKVDIFGFKDLVVESEVSPQGTLSLPLVGEVFVRGKDTAALRTDLIHQYSRFIRAPSVDVSLRTHTSHVVSIIGEVTKPGIYPLKRPGQLITELISEAGGKTVNAGGRIVLLPAPQNGNKGKSAAYQQMSATSPEQQPATPPNAVMGVEIDLDDLLGSIDRQPLLVPLVAGDTVVVPEGGTYEVDGEVLEPGSFKLAARTSTIGAIAAAGGFTYSADVNKVEIIREIGAGRKALVTVNVEEIALKGTKDIRLRNGDLVRVPSEPGQFFKRQVVTVLNSIFNGVGVTRRVN